MNRREFLNILISTGYLLFIPQQFTTDYWCFYRAIGIVPDCAKCEGYDCNKRWEGLPK